MYRNQRRYRATPAERRGGARASRAGCRKRPAPLAQDLRSPGRPSPAASARPPTGCRRGSAAPLRERSFCFHRWPSSAVRRASRRRLPRRCREGRPLARSGRPGRLRLPSSWRCSAGTSPQDSARWRPAARTGAALASATGPATRYTPERRRARWEAGRRSGSRSASAREASGSPASGRLAVTVHLFGRELAEDRAGQHRLDEHVLLHDHLLPGSRGPERLEHLARLLRPLVPGHRPPDRLHEGDSVHIALVPPRVVEAKRRPPVVNDERHVPQAQRIDEAVDIAGMVEEAVVKVGFVGLSHADQVERDAAADGRDVRYDVSPEIGRRRVAVQEQHRVAATFFDVVHPRAEYVNILRFVREARRYLSLLGHVPLSSRADVQVVTEPGCLRFASGWYHSTPPEGSPRAESMKEEKKDGSQSRPCGIRQRHALFGG